jgi:hypothetical protein
MGSYSFNTRRRRFAADVLPFWSPEPGGTGRRTLVVGLLLLLLGISWSCFLVVGGVNPSPRPQPDMAFAGAFYVPG